MGSRTRYGESDSAIWEVGLSKGNITLLSICSQKFGELDKVMGSDLAMGEVRLDTADSSIGEVNLPIGKVGIAMVK